ncbi:MAG: PKD domain-containing protein [Marinoscillum sp.]
MKKQLKNVIRNGWLLMGVLALTMMSCDLGEDEPEPGEVIAGFTYEISEDNYQEVTFINISQNADTYSWDFGDGNTSTEKDPVYSYAEEATYEVTLTATGAAGSKERKETIKIENPNKAMERLTGTDGKVWQLIADVSTGRYPYEVGPNARNEIWWASGRNEGLCVRECVFDDTWTFNTDGTFTYDNNGDYFGDGAIWAAELVTCFDASDNANYVNSAGTDVSDWNSGTHNFTYTPSEKSLVINGGFIGLPKVGSEGEFTVPQESVEYEVVEIIEGDVDTLVLETTLVEAGGYWRFVLVSYGTTPEVTVDECEEVTSVNVTFSVNMNDYTGTATTPELNGTFNGWCGNCNAMTDDNDDGIWQVTVELPVGDQIEYKFSADSWADQESLTEGSSCTVTNDGNTNRFLTVGETNMTVGTVCWNSCDNCSAVVTQADLTGKEWKVINGPGAVRVGPGIGNGSWFTSDQAWIDAAPCLVDDVFSFDANGGFTIDVKEQVFTEATMTGIEANGCVAIADLPTELANWDGGTFTYTMTEATDEALPMITVTGSGAYIGFYKGANGKELAQPEDGSITYTVLSYIDRSDRDIMEVTVDISEAQDGTAYWTYKLEAANN